jgi:hypothetical protein
MLQEANREIRRAARDARRRDRAERLTSVVRAIDDLLFSLEDLNLRGVDRVPTALRNRASRLLELVPEPDPEDASFRVRYRVVPLMDVLFRAQELLFRARDPDRPRDEDEEELDTA